MTPHRARSSIDAFNELGYTVLYTYTELEAVMIYQVLPDLVSTLLLEASSIANCVQRGVARKLTDKELTNRVDLVGTPPGEEGSWGWAGMIEGTEKQEVVGCVRKRGYEEGIPIWKMHSFHFWGGPEHIVGEVSYLYQQGA